MSGISVTLKTGRNNLKVVSFEEEKKEKDVQKISFRNVSYVLLKSLKTSSVYAISQLAHSQDFRRRILWAVMLIVGFSGLIYQAYKFLTLYFQYPVVITLEVQSGRMLYFPGVTVCNLNRLKSDYIPCMHKNLAECLAEVEGKRGKDSTGFALPTNNLGLPGFETNNYQNTSPRQKKVDLLNLYENLNSSQRKYYGYDAKELIVSCTYNGETCSYKNFTHFESIQYGNCYTFNGRKSAEKPLRTKYTGPNSSGLELILDLKVATYTLLAPAIGARINIHEPTEDPNPEEYGLNVNPGEETSMAMEMNTIQRLPSPYRDHCRQYNPDENLSSYEACDKQCIQNLSQMLCSCVDPKFLPKHNVSRCNLSDIQQAHCLRNVFDLKNEHCDCPLPCVTIDYLLTISTASWPPPYFKGRLRPTAQKTDTQLNTISFHLDFLNDSFRKNESARGFLPSGQPVLEVPVISPGQRFSVEEVKENEAKVKIFFQGLQVKSYKQEPMFQESELFSQLGGQMGLWLGLSLVAMFECIEGMLHLVNLCMYNRKMKKKDLAKN